MRPILIKDGIVINAESSQKADVLIENGKIKEVARNISANNVVEIHAKGKYVIPGGIDPHVHLDLQTQAGRSSDDFYSGSMAAITGGTTTLIDFVTPERGESYIDALHKRKREAEKSLIDYSFHVSPTWWGGRSADEMKQCVEKEGITSFKIYMAYKNSIGLNDAEIINVLETAANLKALVTVHCEHYEIIEKLRNDFIKNGKTLPRYHYLSRPAEAEAEAVNRLIMMAGEMGCPVYVVHVSTKDSIRHIKEARKKGAEVYAETCPQYLVLNNEVYKNDSFDIAKYVISPPIRSKSNVKGLWKAVSKNHFDTIGTDHCPFNLRGQKDAGKDDFTKIPNGAGGIEYRLSLLYTFGVLQEKINLNQWVDLCSAKPAKIFGMADRKGAIKPGMDADVVIWNPNKKQEISIRNQYQKCDSNIYEGIELYGLPETVIVNGINVFDKGILNTGKSRGRFLYRNV